jgi:FMN phosphatase YigB (HAD superfamily)
VPEPADVFLLLGRKLADEGLLATHLSAVQFAELRRAAERAAREKAQAATGYREIRLADIYAGLPDALFAPGFTRAARARTEVALEASLLTLDTDLAALVAFAKGAGAKVFFVSDTYFAAEEIRTLLDAAGFRDFDAVDRLYVSCEAGRPKYRDLFDTVLQDADVAAPAFVHIGDNLDADIHPCRQRGIVCVHYDKWAFAPRVQTEEFSTDLAQRASQLGAVGDFGLTGLRARLQHRPPPGVRADLRSFWSYGASILAPVFAGFARWILQEAQERHLYGLMREGRFLGQVVRQTATDLALPANMSELWLSRRAVLRAALWPDDLSRLPEAVALTPGRTAAECLARLDLTVAEVSSAAPGYDPTHPGARAQLATVIAAAPALRAKVLALSARLRANLLKGLRAQADVNAGLVVVDLGYAATIQTVLCAILAREGIAAPLTGLYLAANEKGLINTRAGIDLRAYLNASGYAGLTGALLSRTPDVLEHACMCREGSLDGYDEAGLPVLLPNQRDTRQLEQMEAMQAGILAGVSAVNTLLGDLQKTPAHQPELRGHLDRIIQAALLHPTLQEAETIGAWRHEANFDLEDVRRLKDVAFDARALQYKGWPALQEIGRHQVYWPAAAFAAAAPFFGQVFAAGVRQAYAADHMASGPALGAIMACPDLGIGFDSKREGALPLVVNAFGRGEIAVTLKPANPEAYRRLRLRFPTVRAALSIDHFDVDFVGQNEQRTIDLLEANRRRLSWAHAEATSGDVLFTTAAGTVLTIDMADDIPPWVHMMSLRLRFKYLRLDDLFR